MLWGILNLAGPSQVRAAPCEAGQPIGDIPAKRCTREDLQLVMMGCGLSMAQRSLDWLQTPALLAGESSVPPEDFALNKSLLHSNPMFLMA